MLKSAKSELKAKNLPIAFTPRGAPSGMVAINASRDQVSDIRQVMVKHGYQWADTFIGTDTDLQICFKPSRSC